MKTRKNRNQLRHNAEKLARAIGVPTGFERLEDRTMLSNTPILVTNTLDDGSAGSLRWAIDQANADSDADVINFQISGSDQTIPLQDGLTITNPLTINGLAKPGEGNNPLIWLDGDSAFAPLTLQGNNITIAGLGFTHFTASPAVVVQGSNNHIGVADAAARNVFFGNYTGIDVQGTADQTSIVGNVISASDVSGVSIDGATHVTVAGNLIGIDYALDPSDPTFVPGPVYIQLNGSTLRGAYGVYVTNTAPGSSVLVDGNTIAAAGDGVRLDNAAGVTLTRNLIGTDPTGATSSFLAYGNAIGIHLMGAAHDNVIGAADPANGNVVAGSEGNGIWIEDGSNDNGVLGNRIGVDANGTSGDGTFGNRNNGVEIDDSTGNLIAGNVISNNLRDGVRLLASGNTVYGNQIGGKGADGIKVGNGYEGVHIEGDNNVIGGPADGQGNVVSFNGDSGVAVVSGTGNRIRGNSIHDNTTTGDPGAGIDLYTVDDVGDRHFDGPTANGDADAVADGPNHFQHFPHLVSAIGPAGAIKVSGYLDDAVAGQTYTFDLYANTTGSADGEIYLGSVTVTATANGRLDFTGKFAKVDGTHLSLTATTTDAAGNTSEFSGPLDATIIVPLATTTTLSSSAAPTFVSRPGKDVTFTARVVDSHGASALSGSVTFFDGAGNPLGTVNVVDGVATLTVSTLSLGGHTITATYAAGDGYLDSASGPVSHTVAKAASTTTVNSSANPAVVGSPITLTATISVAPGEDAPTGTVTFKDGDTVLATNVLVVSGVATVDLSWLPAGTHAITAIFISSAATIEGSAGSLSQQVNQAASTTTVTLPEDAVVGQPTTLTAHVAGVPGVLPSGGTVTFFENDAPIGSGTIAADGSVSITYTFTSATRHTITATYAGDANFTDSTGAAATSVAKADTTVSLTSSANPSVVGNSVTFTVTVSGGYGDLTDGVVVFKDGSIVLATVPVGAGNKASFTTTFQNADGHQITATFQGSANSADSESAPLNQVVNKAATTTSLSASGTSTTYGDAITFTATVGVLGSPLAATGVVQFFDGSTLLGEVALDDSAQASLTVSSLAGGVHSITAVYVGSDTHLASNSNSIAVSVTVPSTDVPFQASGHTLRDTSGNGLSADDTALGGVTVKIFKDSNNNGVLDSADALFTTVVSNSSGLYSLTLNAAGRFFAQEVTPTGYLQTGPTSGYYTFTASVNNAATSLDFSNWKQCDCCDDLVNITYLVNGSVVPDLRGNTHPGDLVQVKFTVPAGSTPMTLSLVSYTAPSGVWDATVASQQKIWEQQTGTFGPGTYTLTVNLPDTFYQVDFVCGPVIDKLGPVGSNIFYSAQDRLFSADNGGSLAYVEGSSSLSGFVYNDLDNDGVRDNNEPGIAGVKVLLSGADAAGNAVSRWATTDSRGRYAFANVLEGNYSVTETQPAGYLNGKETPTNVFGNVKITATRGSRTGYNFGEIVASKLSGFVYVDANNDGVKQSTEKGLAGVTLSLVNANGSVVATTTTDSTGAYTFGTVAAGSYSILETQPAHYVDGIETAGTLGGYDGGDNNTISAINVGSGQAGTNYNFGELPESFVCTGETATIGFWQNKNGQNLIKSFNGSSTSKMLAKWLSQTFPNLYGSSSPNNLNGKTNADVATLFTKLFNVSGQKLDAQVLAVALAVYSTTNSLGGTAAAKYGFTVDAIGTGHRLYNIGSNGAAFGVANNTNMEVLDILDAANDRAVNGVLYNGNTTLRNMANTVFTGINEQGDIA